MPKTSSGVVKAILRVQPWRQVLAFSSGSIRPCDFPNQPFVREHTRQQRRCRGGPCSRDAANIAAAPNCRLEGVLMRVTPAIRDLLRRKEGWPHCYDEIGVPVTIPSSGRTITAITYVVVSEHRLPFDLPVAQDYRQVIVDAATEFKFSPAYRRHLRDLLVVAPDSMSISAG
jgi:hypothetical protein